MTTAAERFAHHIVETGFDRLPANAVSAGKSFILDSIGVAVAGAKLRDAERLREVAKRWGEQPEASVLGTNLRLPAPSAARLNGYQIHCQEFDCIHETAVVHPMAIVLSSSLAYAERMGGVPGKALLLAVILGVDVAISLGVAARGPLRFFRPATAGAFGAVAACGKLAAFDVRAMINGFGLVLGQVSGTMQSHIEGKPLLPVQIGFNARNAIVAADLVATGLEGPLEVFEGRHGYLPLFEGEFDLTPALGALGRVWRVSELSHKPFPSGRATHGGIDGILQLKARHGFTAADVARVTLRVPPLVAQLCGRPDRADPAPNYARLCLPYACAVALLYGNVGLADFEPKRLRDPAVHALAQRITVASDESVDETALLPQTAAVELKNRTTHEIHLDAVLGGPARPLTQAQRIGKFHGCWRAGLAGLGAARAEELIAAVDALETLENCDRIASLATP